MSDGGGRQHVLWQLVRTARLTERRFTAVFAEHGLTPAQYGVLAGLADGDDLSQAELARAVLVRPQSMAALIDAMVDQGLVSREGAPGRGRRKTLILTEHGRRLFSAARPAAYALLETEVSGLDPAAADQLSLLLGQVHDHLLAAERRRPGDRVGSRGPDGPSR